MADWRFHSEQWLSLINSFVSKQTTKQILWPSHLVLLPKDRVCLPHHKSQRKDLKWKKKDASAPSPRPGRLPRVGTHAQGPGCLWREVNTPQLSPGRPSWLLEALLSSEPVATSGSDVTPKWKGWLSPWLRFCHPAWVTLQVCYAACQPLVRTNMPWFTWELKAMRGNQGQTKVTLGSQEAHFGSPSIVLLGKVDNFQTNCDSTDNMIYVGSPGIWAAPQALQAGIWVLRALGPPGNIYMLIKT
jgi:hypothetical protein